ncbi:MAG: hypothetical protein C0602_08085 [Denitrovibrio sp.]|nr:MAG: hypothetical protein C0602_08085 [Denitrovibrio sp.]
MKKVLVLSLMMVCSVAFAGDFGIQSTMTQDQFKSLAKEIGLIVTPTPNSPAEPLKTFGFDVAVEAAVININSDEDYWENACDGNDPSSHIAAYRVHAQKGFPFGLDLGLSVTKGGNLGFTAITGEVKYAILKGTVVTPAISVKGSVTKVTGLEDMSVMTGSIGAYISKGFLFLTPYAGIESVAVKASDDSGNDFDDETVASARGIVGLQISPLPLISINLEAAKGTVMQYGLKAGIRF